MISLVGSIIFLFSSPPQSYFLFLLFVSLAVLLVFNLTGQNREIIIRFNLSSTTLLSYLVILSTVLLILQIANVYIEAFNSVLYVFVFILALGLSILSICKFKPAFSRIEFLGLAVPLSLGFLSLFGTLVLLVPSAMRGSIESLAIVILCIIALVLKKKERVEQKTCEQTLKVDNAFLILVMIVVFFAFFFIELYPQISTLLQYDISRNFTQALAFSKDVLGTFSNPGVLYPLFAVYQSSIIYVVKPSIEAFQVISILLNIFVIFSFYTMASQYLHKYGNKTAVIATLIWSLFSGLGWLTFFHK